MLDFQFIKNALGLQEKENIISEIDGEILKLVVSSDTTEQICLICGLKTTRMYILIFGIQKNLNAIVCTPMVGELSVNIKRLPFLRRFPKR